MQSVRLIFGSCVLSLGVGGWVCVWIAGPQLFVLRRITFDWVIGIHVKARVKVRSK